MLRRTPTRLNAKRETAQGSLPLCIETTLLHAPPRTPRKKIAVIFLGFQMRTLPRDCTAGARGIHGVYSEILIEQQQHTWLQL